MTDDDFGGPHPLFIPSQMCWMLCCAGGVDWCRVAVVKRPLASYSLSPHYYLPLGGVRETGFPPNSQKCESWCE